VVPGDLEALSLDRAARARLLARRYPASREALLFCAEVAAFQQEIAGAGLEERFASRERLVQAVTERGPALLREAARGLGEQGWREALEAYLSRADTLSPRSFFARALLQGSRELRRAPEAGPLDCPRCGHRPQVGCLRPEGHGLALTLVCSVCLEEWPFPRGKCAGCGEQDPKKISYYSAEELPHLHVQVCETCQRYLHHVDLSKDPAAIPAIDELAALPLDVWARERGYRKLQPNLVGI
jgi:formate dehydrogenase maturation protein FdhE